MNTISGVLDDQRFNEHFAESDHAISAIEQQFKTIEIMRIRVNKAFKKVEEV